MDRLFFFFITAVFSSLFWPVLPSLIYTPLLIGLGILCFHKKWLMLCGFLMGICWMTSVGHWLKQTQPDKSLFDTRIVATGEVLTVATKFDEGRFNFRIAEFREAGSGKRKAVNHKVRLSWRNPVFEVQQGQKLQLELKLKPRWGLANEAGFDYQQWLFAKNIIATGYVVDSSENLLFNTNVSERQQLATEFTSLDIPEMRWFLALAVGYRKGLTTEDWQLLQRTGTAHLVAISGMHLGMVALWCYVFLVLLLAISCSVTSVNGPTNIRSSALIMSLVPCFFYAGLAGFSIPTLRAFLMLVFAVGLMKFAINWGFRRFVVVSVMVFILLFPLSIFTMSFWLSFSALVIIGFLLWRFPYKGDNSNLVHKVWYFLRMQFLMTLLMLPLVLLFFDGASMVSPLANSIAVPFVTFVLLPLSLLATWLHMMSSEWLYPVLNLTLYLFSEFERVLQFFANFTMSWLEFGAINRWAGVLATMAILLLLLPRFVVPKGIYFLLFLPLLSGFYQSKSKNWQVDLLDVGQGLSVLIRKNGHAIVYDTGAAYPGGFNMAEAVVLPMLQRANFHYLDKLIISHDDNDHAGGFEMMTNRIPIAEIRRSPHGCHASQDFIWRGLMFDVLWPDSNYPELLTSDNNMSCVIRISDGVNSMLLAGDIEYSVERVLVHLSREKQIELTSTVLIAPHHGSKTSSTSSFIQAVSPQYSLVSAGFRNRWNMPADEVKRRYESADVVLLNTAEQGQLTVRFSNLRPVEVTSWRLNERPRWYLRHF